MVAAALALFVLSRARGPADEPDQPRLEREPTFGAFQEAAEPPRPAAPTRFRARETTGTASFASDAGAPVHLRLRGQVVRAEAGVEGEVVLAHLVATTDSQGVFDLEVDAPPGQAVVVFARRGALRSPWFSFRSSEPPEWLRLSLREPVTITGTTVDRETQSPVPQVVVTCVACGGDQATTDDKGRFTFASAPLSEGGLVVLHGVGAAGVGHGEYLATPGRPLEVTMVMVRPVPIAGRVVDGSGRGVEGVLVSVSRKGEVLHKARSAVDGAFTLDAFKQNTAVVDAVADDGRASISRVVVAPTSGLTLVLGEGASVRASVVDEHGALVEGATVQAKQVVTKRACTTSAEGTCVLQGLQQGPVVVKATVGRVATKQQTLSVVAAGTTVSLELEPRRAVRGQVVTTSQTPAVGARVSVDGEAPFATTDARGHFVLENLAAGEVELSATSADGALGAALTVAEEVDDVVLTLEPASRRVSGRVVDAKGTPRVFFSVEEQQVTHGDGAFSIRVPYDASRLTVRCEGCSATAVDVPAGSSDLGVGDVTVADAATAEVLVLGPNGQPVPDAHLWTISAPPDRKKVWRRMGTAQDSQTDARGRSVFSNSGWCLMVAVAPLLPTVALPCPLNVAETPNVVVQMTRGGFVEVEVRQASAGAPIMVTDDTEGLRDVIGSDGRCTLGPLAPGPHDIVVARPDFTLEAKPVVVRDGQTERVVFGESSEARLEVHVTAGQGLRMVAAIPGDVATPPKTLSSDFKAGVADDQGVVHLTNLSAGRWTVFVGGKGDEVLGRVVVELAPGQSAVVEVPGRSP